MALRCKVDNDIEFILGEKSVHKGAIANITTHKCATIIINIISDGTEIAGVCKQIKNNNTHVVILCQNILKVVSSDKTGSPSY